MFVEKVEFSDLEEVLAFQRLICDDVGIDGVMSIRQTYKEIVNDFERQEIFKIVVDAEIVGCIRAQCDGEVCYVGRLCVHPDFRKQGIGTMLVMGVETKFCHSKRYESFTKVDNKKMIDLYSKLGYSETRSVMLKEGYEVVFFEKRSEC